MLRICAPIPWESTHPRRGRGRCSNGGSYHVGPRGTGRSLLRLLAAAVFLALTIGSHASAQEPGNEAIGGLSGNFPFSGTTPGLVIDETRWVWEGDPESRRVRVPVRLFADDKVDFVQFSVDFDDEWLEYGDVERASTRWLLSSRTPVFHDASESLLRGALYRRGSSDHPPPDEGEHIFDLIFEVRVEDFVADTYRFHTPLTFTVHDPRSLTMNPLEETFLGGLQGNEENGSVAPFPSILVDGGIDIYYADGLEIGRGSLTRRAQKLTLPVFATLIGTTRGEQDHTLTIGVDYDELILRTSRVREVGRVDGENGEPRDLDVTPRAGGRGLRFTVSIPVTGPDAGEPTPVLRKHVADIEFDFLGGTATGGLPVGATLSIRPTFENAGQREAPGVSLPGQLRILPPWFVRGNVDSSIHGDDSAFPDGALLDDASARADTARLQPRLRDGLAILEFLFDSSRPAPRCLEAADVNGDGQVGLDDSVLMLNYLYNGGQEPVAPFPTAGVSPVGSRLGCERPLPVFQRR